MTVHNPRYHEEEAGESASVEGENDVEFLQIQSSSLVFCLANNMDVVVYVPSLADLVSVVVLPGFP